jgi:hypothetical protein
MKTAVQLPGPWVWAMAGALVGVLGLVLPQWWYGADAASVADEAPLIAIVVVALYGQSSLAGVPQTTRLLVALAVPTLQAVLVGFAAYWLYGTARPELLAARYARRLATASTETAADLHGHAAHWLSPAAQAVDLAQMLWVGGFVVSGFVAFRARVAQRRAVRG